MTFTSKLNSITITETSTRNAPTVDSVKKTVLPRLASTIPAFVPGNVTTVKRPAGSAILTTYQADSVPDPVTNKVVREARERYEFYKNGHLAVITLAGPKGADNVDPWKTVTNSVSWRP